MGPLCVCALDPLDTHEFIVHPAGWRREKERYIIIIDVGNRKSPAVHGTRAGGETSRAEQNDGGSN